METEVPVLRRADSVVEQEFDSIRDKFEQEMSRMEVEMERLRSQLSPEVAGLSRTTSSTSSRSSSSRRTTSTRRIETSSMSSGGALESASGQSPLVKVNEDGSSAFRLRFDLADYEPEQIVVTTLDNRLRVSATSRLEAAHKALSRRYERELLLPDQIEPHSIKSWLSADGVLTVEAPLANLL